MQGTEVATVLDSGDRLGRTPLHYAASQKTGLSYITNLLKVGRRKTARRGRQPGEEDSQLKNCLTQAGANIDFQDHSGMTPLHLACR